MTQASHFATPSPLLAASGLNSGYGGGRVLRDVALSIAPGEALCLLGRNGMGKTTLLRTLAGQISGGVSAVIRFAGADIAAVKTADRARRGLSLVPEGRGIFPNLTVEENLTLAARKARDGGTGWTREAIYNLFPRLRERRRNWGDQLSGGEQQMLSIGRALMTNPSLLMLDEATEGLAPLVRAEIWTTLRTVRDSGIAVIVVDKNLTDLFAFASRAMVLAKGETVFDGPTEALRGDAPFIHRWLGV